MGVQAFAEDLGRVVPIRLHIDSSAALSKISRTGLGKAKHIDIQYLWHKLTVEKITSETNFSDLGTKHLTSERSETLMKLRLKSKGHGKLSIHYAADLESRFGND